MKTTDKEVKLYFKQIRMTMPVYSKKEKEFLRKFKKVVHTYIEENPADVAYNYISSLDQEEIFKRISVASFIKKAIVITVVAIIVALVVAVISEWAILYDLHKKAEDAIVTKEITVIE